MNHCNSCIESYSSVDLGNEAETEACIFLQKNGMQFIQQNYRFEKYGEIDLIMRDGIYLVFIEVKLRNENDYGEAIEMISIGKRARIIRAAKRYLQEKRLVDKEFCRFDVVAISPRNKEKITWIQDAFQVE